MVQFRRDLAVCRRACLSPCRPVPSAGQSDIGLPLRNRTLPAAPAPGCAFRVAIDARILT